MNNKFAHFITIDGVDCAGKSTAISGIKKYFEDLGETVECTREPGGTLMAEDLRSIVLDKTYGDESATNLTRMMLMFAARFQNYEFKILPALASGNVIISDRWTPATFAYQVNSMEDLELFNTLCKRLDGLQPISFIFDIDYETYLKRMTERPEQMDNIERDNAGIYKFERLRKKYLECAKLYHHIVIDARGDTDSILKQIVSYLNEEIKHKGTSTA